MVLFLYTQMRILVRVNNKLYPCGGDWNLFIIYATDGIDRYGVDLVNITRLVNLSYDVLELWVGVNVGTYLSRAICSERRNPAGYAAACWESPYPTYPKSNR